MLIAIIFKESRENMLISNMLEVHMQEMEQMYVVSICKKTRNVCCTHMQENEKWHVICF